MDECSLSFKLQLIQKSLSSRHFLHCCQVIGCCLHNSVGSGHDERRVAQLAGRDAFQLVGLTLSSPSITWRQNSLFFPVSKLEIVALQALDKPYPFQCLTLKCSLNAMFSLILIGARFILGYPTKSKFHKRGYATLEPSSFSLLQSILKT